MISDKISIVIPAYNEKDNLTLLIPEVVGVMSEIVGDFEIVVVDDGSTDDSMEAIKRNFKDCPNLRYIQLPIRVGQSRAIFCGIEESRGGIIVTMDADLQNDSSDIPMMLCDFDGVDMVCGFRHNRKDGVVKEISSKIANLVRRKTLDSDIIDSACGLKVMRKKCLENIEFFDGIHRFLPDLFLINGFKVKQAKINHRPRIIGKSNYGIKNRIFKGIFDLIMVRNIKRKYCK